MENIDVRRQVMQLARVSAVLLANLLQNWALQLWNLSRHLEIFYKYPLRSQVKVPAFRRESIMIKQSSSITTLSNWSEKHIWRHARKALSLGWRVLFCSNSIWQQSPWFQDNTSYTCHTLNQDNRPIKIEVDPARSRRPAVQGITRALGV